MAFIFFEETVSEQLQNSIYPSLFEPSFSLNEKTLCVKFEFSVALAKTKWVKFVVTFNATM